MKFTKTLILDKTYPHYDDNYKGYYEWHSGIYHIVGYASGEYHAYYMPDSFKCWGNHVSKPTEYVNGSKCWATMESAKKACLEHAKTHKPSNRTRTRADILFKEHLKKKWVHSC